MPMFLLGITLIYSALAAAALKDFSFRSLAEPWPRNVIIAVWIIPVLTGWAAAEITRALRGQRLRLFHRARPRPIARLVFGLCSGTLGATLALVTLVLIPNPPSDAIVMAVGSTLGTMFVFAFARTIRRGTCPACNYDLRDLTPASAGRCPECGFTYSSGPSYTPPGNPSKSVSTLVRA